jgi:hypothetical protein
VTPAISRSFVFDNASGRKLSGANPAVLTAPVHALLDTCCSNVSSGSPAVCLASHCNGLPQGFPALCPGPYPGDAVLDGNPLPYELTLNKGDSLIVEARRSPAAPPIRGLQLGGDPPPLLSGLTVNGVLVQASDLVGNVSSGSDPAGSISFYYVVK